MNRLIAVGAKGSNANATLNMKFRMRGLVPIIINALSRPAVNVALVLAISSPPKSAGSTIKV
jgi:hypothetical protein